MAAAAPRPPKPMDASSSGNSGAGGGSGKDTKPSSSGTATPGSATPALDTPLRLGCFELRNRWIMAPLTRCQAAMPGHIPTPLMAAYYSQRATYAGLIVTEATMVVSGQSVFYSEPAICDEAQIQGWRWVTDAVHGKGGRIFCQLFHGGRQTADVDEASTGAAVPSLERNHMSVDVPEHELTDAEVRGLVQAFAQAASNAIAAGFDGVEIHAANGYLLDQFWRDGTNRRGPPYGGSVINRARMILEVVDACSKAIGNDRIGVRVSPLNSFNGMQDSDPVGITGHLCEQLSKYNIAYVHIIRRDFLGLVTGDVVSTAREKFKGPLIVNQGFEIDEAEAFVGAKGADAVSFGVKFLANPDLPKRGRLRAPLNEPRPQFFYRPGEEGYTDYPFLVDVQQPQPQPFVGADHHHHHHHHHQYHQQHHQYHVSAHHHAHAGPAPPYPAEPAPGAGWAGAPAPPPPYATAPGPYTTPGAPPPPYGGPAAC